MKRLLSAFAVTLICASAAHAQKAAAADETLQKLEAAKWRPSTLGSAAALRALFASDFITIEYGSDPTFSGVNRAIDGKKLMETGGEDALIRMMDQMTFHLTEWHFQHISPDVVLVSYQVASPQFGDARLWATSIWRRKGSTWETVFYQASKAH